MGRVRTHKGMERKSKELAIGDCDSFYISGKYMYDPYNYEVINDILSKYDLEIWDTDSGYKVVRSI